MRSFGRYEPEAVCRECPLLGWPFLSIGTIDYKLYICCYRLMARRPNVSRQTRVLLAVLVEQPRAWRHGYELSKDTGLKSGTLYPLLMRLCDQGFLDSRWKEPEKPGRPPRHVYRLTASGQVLVRELVASMGGLSPDRGPVGVGA